MAVAYNCLIYQSVQDYRSVIRLPHFYKISMISSTTSSFSHLFFWFQPNPSSIPLFSFPSKHHNLVVQAGNPEITVDSIISWLNYHYFFLFYLPSLVCLLTPLSIILHTFGRVWKWNDNLIVSLFSLYTQQPHPLVFIASPPPASAALFPFFFSRILGFAKRKLLTIAQVRQVL